MSDEKYYAILTDLGQQLITEAYQAGEVVTITQLAFGDADQAYVAPDPAMNMLVNQTDMLPLVRGPQAEDIIGGGVDILSDDYPDSWIYEAGLFDANGNLIVYASYPPTLIPPSTDSVKKGVSLDIGLIMSATDNITVYVDPTIEALTRAAANMLYLQILNNLSEIKDAGNEAQLAARRNIAAAGSVNGIGPDENTNITLTASDVGALPDDYVPPAAPVTSVNNKTGAVVLTAADVHALPDSTVIPGPPDLSAYMKTADANAKFLQGVQFGASTSHSVSDNQSFSTAGYALTGFFSDDNNDDLDTLYAKPVQEDVNGVWKTIAG